MVLTNSVIHLTNKLVVKHIYNNQIQRVMTPKEKAEELIKRFCLYVDNTGDDLYFSRQAQINRAKKCALITVKELIDFIPANPYPSLRELSYQYWQEVKKEIESYEST